MDKIFIFYGPKNAFKTYLPDDDELATLAEAVRLSDMRRKSVRVINGEVQQDDVEPEYYEHLVAFSESYAGVTEGAIQSFITLINEFEIDNLYLQNPPTYIREQIEQVFPNIISFKEYEYKSITNDMFLTVAESFDSKIIGQENAKEQLLISLYSLMKSSSNKPAVIMLYGVSGVGKTETAKYISDVLGQAIFRKQCSMFHSGEFSSYIFGGAHSQSSFAKDLLERESNVILLDEFDKPNPIFHSAFYQMFDEGIFEDKNYKVNLSKAIIFCTSNYQSEDDIRKHLGDPIFYRFDKFVKYSKLSIESMKKVITSIFHKKQESLSFEEVAILNLSHIEQIFIDNASNFHNVRNLNTIINDYIDSELMYMYLKNIQSEKQRSNNE